MGKLLIARVFGGSVRGYSFWCPACAELHTFNVSGTPPLWGFNEDTARPKFWPSLRYSSGNQCHLYVSDGKIHYCSDCLHDYAGRTVDMVELSNTGGPMAKKAKDEDDEKDDAKAKKGSGSHSADCGDVGQTGAHGKLGENAAGGAGDKEANGNGEEEKDKE